MLGLVYGSRSHLAAPGLKRALSLSLSLEGVGRRSWDAQSLADPEEQGDGRRAAGVAGGLPVHWSCSDYSCTISGTYSIALIFYYERDQGPREVT